MCAGVLLPGGGDVDPVHFNEKCVENIEPNDQLDETIVCHALQKASSASPGMQAINVFMGALYQDTAAHKHIISGHKLETFP